MENLEKTQAVLLLKIKEMAEKHNMSISDMKDICYAPFGLLKKTIEESSAIDNNFPTVKIPYFITFFVKEKRKEYLVELETLYPNRQIKRNLRKKEEEVV